MARTPEAQRARDDATLRREARERDAFLQDTYEEGIEEGVRRGRDRRRSGGHETPAQGAARERRRSTSSSRRRRRRRAPASARRAARELKAPVAAQLYSGVKAIGVMLTLVALYHLLNNANVASEVLGGVRRGFDWLKSPERSITYA